MWRSEMSEIREYAISYRSHNDVSKVVVRSGMTSVNINFKSMTLRDFSDLIHRLQQIRHETYPSLYPKPRWWSRFWWNIKTG